MSVYDTLKKCNITLPEPAVPAADYVMSMQSGNFIYVSGHIAKKEGAPWVGKLGDTIDTPTGAAAARSIAIDLLATLHAHTGDLNRIKRIVKLVSLVNVTPEYKEAHLVTNGASKLLMEILGEKGKHARSALGVAQLPLGACVEIELIVEVE